MTRNQELKIMFDHASESARENRETVENILRSSVLSKELLYQALSSLTNLKYWSERRGAIYQELT